MAVTKYTEKSPLTTEAENLLASRYFKDGETSWLQVVERVCAHLGIDRDATFDMIYHRYMLPNTPTLVNAGTGSGLSACYVLGMEDTIEGIYRTKFDVARIARAGGGVGIALSHLRPANSIVRGSSHTYAAGPVAFASTIAHDAKILTQAGTLRPMALMFVMDVNHPDIYKFITAKSEEGTFTNANMSVMVDNAFMQAVIMNSLYDLSFGGVVYETIRARELFETMMEHTHKNGEPGLLFREKINTTSPYSEVGLTIDATNPCGEIPAPANAVCTLGSLNLANFVNEYGRLERNLLVDAVIRSVDVLDRVVTHNKYPTEATRTFAEKYRNIGLGVMGVADMFLKMGITYGSAESVRTLREIMGVIASVARQSSMVLASERGEPDFNKYLKGNQKVRNITRLSIAPTGSISLIAGCSSGIEPIFSPTMFRVNGAGAYEVAHPMADHPCFVSAVHPDKTKVVTVREHLEILSAAQEHVDSGVSKTINVPNDATVFDVREAALSAWGDPFIKGVAIYRDGSRSVQVLSSAKESCPECGAHMKTDGGCRSCSACGWSVCLVA